MIEGASLADALLTLGEVHTGLLQHSSAVSAEVATRLLDTMPGVRVFRSDRPISFVRSQPSLTGVDCLLPDARGRRVRCIGTVWSRTAITGGRVVQTSSYVTVAAERGDQRRPWAYYLARPGRLEPLTAPDGDQLAKDFLHGPATPERLDLDAISRRAMDDIQVRPALDRRRPLRAPRTRLRWLVDPSAGDHDPVVFALVNDTERVIRLASSDSDVLSLVEFCEDAALHDWLLTTLLSQVSRSGIGTAERSDVVDRLTPTVEHLLHLWMPAARTHPDLAPSWTALERHLGFTRQWRATADRVRDQLALNTWERLGPTAGREN